ncbi:MAG: lysine 2,3-aminomutase [Saprospiraceae bacterium]|nr:lysine 2,3-aminomutase [Saprospiraceae bacterium]
MKYKSYSLHNYLSIPQVSLLSEQTKRDISVVANVLPFKVNNYVLDHLINWDDLENDAMYHLTFPQKGMLSEEHYNEMAEAMDKTDDKIQLKVVANKIRYQLNPHPAGQKEYNVPEIDGEKLWGVQHKYREIVLFFPSAGQTCHSYCTFCFRWPQFVGMEELKFAMKETELLVKYLEEHQEVTDILFTGGDPMIMSFKVFEKYIEPFISDDNKTNIQTIRIGSKALGFWPYKFVSDPDADQFLELFERIVKKGINLSFMAHFSHPVELSTEVVKTAISRLRSTGMQIRSQSPILKHINDTADVWSEMWREQVNLNVIPYYMFIPRDTGARDYFAVPLVKAWEIFRSAYTSVSGICRSVRGPSMSCTPGKIQILGVSEINKEKVIALRFLQGRDPDWVGRPFYAKYDAEALWIDDLEPAFSEAFFFENEMAEMY